jgi:hypothetical protein
LLTKDRFEDQFLKSVKEGLIKLNYANWFIIHFLDITWNSITSSISNNNYIFWYTYWLLQKEQFIMMLRIIIIFLTKFRKK